MKKRQTCLLLCFICLLSFCGGCAHTKTKRELDSLAVVLGIAIDKAEEKDEIGSESFGEDSEKLLLTAQVVRNISISQNSSESESSGSGNEGDLGRPYWNVQVVGSNLLETLRSAIHITNRRLYVRIIKWLLSARILRSRELQSIWIIFFGTTKHGMMLALLYRMERQGRSSMSYRIWNRFRHRI